MTFVQITELIALALAVAASAMVQLNKALMKLQEVC